MNNTIEKFGAFLGDNVEKHPDAVRRVLSGVYSAIGFQASKFPGKGYTSSREYLQGYTAKILAGSLKHPERTAVVNIFMSCEIFHVLGIPVSIPEGLSVYLRNTAIEQPFIQAAQENGASENFCSFHRILLGLAETGVLRAPALIANTTLACDANQLSFRRMAEIWKVPHFVVDIPYASDEEAVSYVAEQLRELAVLAQDCVHRKLEEDKLKEAVARSIRSQEYFMRYLQKRAEVHLPEAMTPELLSAINNHVYLGLPEAERYCRMLCEDVQAAPAMSPETCRILWMHVLPNAQESLKSIFQGADNMTAEVIGCDLAYDNFTMMDPEKPYESMARRIVQSSYNGGGINRIEKTLEYAKKLHADGIMIFCQWGCKQTQGIAYAAKNIFEDAGFPALVMDGDAGDRTNEASGQTTTRANAFVEELMLRKSIR